ncbi:5,10-methylenetetrahydromethanopterin reductase [Natronorarus salvus]|uniref:5,10-methylenetetrahydromethanopterin reductase n=1 Tax=Natronorarus salvus TaxID=3117733 RepID=UPI002F26CD64
MIGVELTPEHPVERMAELGTAAEAASFEAALASCHYNNRDPFVALSRIARETETIRLGPGVANPYEVHPVSLASRVATLSETSGGRAVFGIGPGDRSTLSSLGVEQERPLRRVLEAFNVAADLFSGERVDHDGTFSAESAALNFEVGDIPIYVGAQGPHMLRMSAKHADGVLYNGAHPEDVAWAAGQVERGLEERPDERGSFDFTVFASTSVAAEREAAVEAARPPVAFIASGAAPPVLDRHGIDAERAEEIGERLSAGSFSEAFSLVTGPMIEAFCVAGTPAEVESRFDAILETSDGIVVGSPLGPDLEEAISLTGDALSR